MTGRSSIPRIPSCSQPIAGPQRKPGVTDLSRGNQPFERFPDGIVADLFETDVVELQKIDAIGLQAV